MTKKEREYRAREVVRETVASWLEQWARERKEGGAYPCSGQSKGPRHWSLCDDSRPGWRPRDKRGRIRLWGSYEAALAACARSNAPRTDEEAPAQAEVRPGGDRDVQGRSGGREE